MTRSRRITRLDLAQEFRTGRSMVGLARKYGLTKKQVEDAIRFVYRHMLIYRHMR